VITVFSDMTQPDTLHIGGEYFRVDEYSPPAPFPSLEYVTVATQKDQPWVRRRLPPPRNEAVLGGSRARNIDKSPVRTVTQRGSPVERST
jgi:hypothetical protein